MKKVEKIREKHALKTCCIILTIVTIFLLAHDYLANNISISTAVVAVFDVAAVLLAALPSKELKHRVIVHQQYDVHFVDRIKECNAVSSFLRDRNTSVLIISGCQGIGKTHLLKTIADLVNFRLRWNAFYCAIYAQIHIQDGVMKAVSEALALDSTSTIEDICGRTKQLKKYKRWVFLLDNVMPENQVEVRDFASAIAYHCPKYKIIIGITKTSHDYELEPGRFGAEELKLLEHSYNIKLSDEERKRIVICSYGLPVYIRFLIENRNHDLHRESYVFSDMDVYIKGLIDDDLSNDGKSLLSVIAFLEGISNEDITVKLLKRISSAANDYSIDELCRFSLIRFQEGKIEIETEIAAKCREVLSVEAYNAYLLIYKYCRHDSAYEHIALRALLRSNEQNTDIELTDRVLTCQHDLRNYIYFVYIGRDYLSKRIHPSICCNKHSRLLFWSFYFDSLLQLGMYPEARKALDATNADAVNFMGILEESTELSFQTYFMMIDLEHLTNHFYEAANYAVALEKMSKSETHRHMCKYLYAHCLKHMGHDLLLAESIFSALVNSARTDDLQRIRALYSTISIHILWEDNVYDFDAAFKKIEKWMAAAPNAQSISPNAYRHYACYLQMIEKNYEKAKEVLDLTIEQLERKPQRIKYDFYFELGEWYRLAYCSNHNTGNYSNSMAYLNKAIDFAVEVGDYNLESMSLLSMALLMSECSMVTEELQDQVSKIISKTKKLKMIINHSYAVYVSYVIQGKQIPPSIISYWKNMRYLQIARSAEKYNCEMSNGIRLLVM